jgi:3,4-dihydroxy 2-butanone 4-phosphate synthase/GTP cyclohydrolase II
VRANAENIRYLMTKRDRMGHDLIGLEDYDESANMDSYDEGVYLLGDRRPSERDLGGAL